ncbi:MAG: GAF domain-containing protein [Actinobacteria bacterium]|nr:GAF domain-containing protein [Cyanobacteriota bacterium]MCL5771158.1 GAF domain-containing protein [Actinomycetota bacterium]
MQRDENIESAKDIIEALSKIGHAITSDLYLEDILKLIVTVTAEVMNSKICSIMLLDDRKNELTIKATQSMSKDYINKNPLKLGEGIAGKVALENKPIAVYNIMDNDDYKNKDIAKKENLSSMLCLPLHVKGKVIGVLNLYTSEPHNFSDYEINILSTVADAASIVIENSKLIVETNLIREELESRKSIERAKGILMSELNLTEEEAFKKIQRFAMNNRKTMREVSEAIIMSHDMKNI